MLYSNLPIYMNEERKQRVERLKQEASCLHFAIEAEDPRAANAIYGLSGFRKSILIIY